MDEFFAKIIFDETHSESWTISEDLAVQIQPDLPRNSSYKQASETLKTLGFSTDRLVIKKALKNTLNNSDVFIIIHPCDSQWEKTTGIDNPKFSPDEIKIILNFVENGGGLILISEYENEKYGSNLNDILSGTDICINNTTVANDIDNNSGNRTWVLFDEKDPTRNLALTQNVKKACFYRAGSCSANGKAKIVCRTSSQTDPSEGLIAISNYGKGRVVVICDSDLFGDEFLYEYDHLNLWKNIIYWASYPMFEKLTFNYENNGVQDKVFTLWKNAKEIIEKIKDIQSSDGSIINKEVFNIAREYIRDLNIIIDSTTTYLNHQALYNKALIKDFIKWENNNFNVPDFSLSIAALNPHSYREQEKINLIILPVYLPNGKNNDTKFEAIIFKTLWPDWLSLIEKKHSNKAFVPGYFIEYTSGFDSECAVFFPEMVSVEKPVGNNFGVIFCDREAQRFSNCVKKCSEILNFAIPPEFDCFISSNKLCTSAFMLWDLIHDKKHSSGHLPYNEFMVKKRMPFWMYAIEELRVDLGAYEEMCELSTNSYIANLSKYAILFDRIFRFPITGNRVKNYDGLAGQLLFGYLYENKIIEWNDLSFSIDWEKLDSTVLKLKHDLTLIYRDAVNLHMSAHWKNTHNFISKYVSPNPASCWQNLFSKNTNQIVESNKDLLALVHEDEFPLNLFYMHLKKSFDENS